MEREDFGDYGDERFLGFCAEDWLEDTRMTRQELQRERELRASDLAEQEVDDAWDAENERDMFDMVREREELEDWENDGEDEEYLDGSWEE